MADSPDQDGGTAQALRALAEATARQADATERQNALTERLLAAVERQTVLAAMGPGAAGDVLLLTTAQACATLGLGETKLAELRRDGTVRGFQMKRGGPWFYPASTLGAAVRTLAEKRR